MVLDYPHQRDPILPPLSPDSLILTSWSRTQRTFAELKRSMGVPKSEGIRCIAFSGSLGRMEQLSHSDADVLILTDGRSFSVPDDDQIWQNLDAVGLPRPDPKGIFGRPCPLASLIAPSSRGKVSEPPQHFGPRIQLLLDSQPLWGEDVFPDIVTGILDWYRATPHTELTVGWDYLIDDLIRYHRALRVLYRWEWQDDVTFWRKQQWKLHFSRRLMIAGLLFLLGLNETQGEQGALCLTELLRLTPLERVCYVYQQFEDRACHQVVAAYEHFLTALSSWEAGSHDDDMSQEVADAFALELADFVPRHREQWAPGFLRGIMF